VRILQYPVINDQYPVTSQTLSLVTCDWELMIWRRFKDAAKAPLALDWTPLDA